MSTQLPWYKEFWPWFIIVLIGSVVIASAVTIRLAWKYDDAPAPGHYQKHGLGITAKEVHPKTDDSVAPVQQKQGVESR